MKYAIKCESLHEKLAVMEYLKNHDVAFQETAWDCREKDFEKYPFVYFDDYYKYKNIGSTDKDDDLHIVKISELLEIAMSSQRGRDLSILKPPKNTQG